MPETIGGDVGIEGKLYRNTGTNAVPVWAECEHVRDLTLSDSWNEGDTSSRSTRFAMSRKTRRIVSVEFSMIHDLLDADFVAILAAYNDKDSVIQFLILNGPVATVGNRGVKAHCQVFQKNENQPMAEGQEVAFVLKPTRAYDSTTLVVPAAFTVSS